MIGNIIIWIKRFLKQQTCKHNYKYVHASYRTNGSCPDFIECTKCGAYKK